MKIMIRRSQSGVLSAYVAKKDLEEPVVEVEKPGMWGGLITLANGWRLELPAMDAATSLPITIEARKLQEDEVQV
jgi:nitrogen fixation protein NifT